MTQPSAPLSEAEFFALVHANPANALVLKRLPRLGLRECTLTAGCLFQTVWNARSDRPPAWGIRDFDVFYFDDGDLSWEAENRVIEAGQKLFADTSLDVQIRNQARVHLWFEQKFGAPRAPLASARQGIDGFLIECTCIGIDTGSGDLYAPHGLEEMWNGVLRINRTLPRPDLFAQKARDYQQRWPWLTIAE